MSKHKVHHMVNSSTASCGMDMRHEGLGGGSYNWKEVTCKRCLNAILPAIVHRLETLNACLIGESKDLLPCQLNIIRRGHPQVNKAFIRAKGIHVVAIEIDMHTKRGQVGAWGSDDDIPLIHLEINDESIGYDTMQHGPTEVSFPEYKGWEVWAADWIKYSVSVCLLNR